MANEIFVPELQTGEYEGGYLGSAQHGSIDAELGLGGGGMQQVGDSGGGIATDLPTFNEAWNTKEANTWYLKNNPDVEKAGVNAWEHYKLFGYLEGRKWLYEIKSIDAELGLGGGGMQQVGDSGGGVFVDDSGQDLGLGGGGMQQVGDSGIGVATEDLPTFNEAWNTKEANTWYLTNNPDVAAAGMNAWEHYKKFGYLEGRKWLYEIKDTLQIDELHLPSNLSQYEGMIVYDTTDWAIFLIENGKKRWYTPTAWEIEPRNGQQKQIPHEDLIKIPLGTAMPEKKAVAVDDLLFDQLDLPKVDSLSCEQIADYLNSKIKFPANLSPTDSKRKQDFLTTITEKYNSICALGGGGILIDNTGGGDIAEETVMADLEKMSCDEIKKEIESISNTLMTARLLENDRKQLEKRLENAKILKTKCDLIADQPPIVKTDVLSNNLKPIVIGLGVVVGLLVVSKLLKD